MTPLTAQQRLDLQIPPGATFVFTDASFSPGLGLAFGACLVVTSQDANLNSTALSSHTISQAEIEGALWALGQAKSAGAITLFTDNKTLAELPGRRNKLMANEFKSRRTQKPLAGASWYQAFYQRLDESPFQLVWVKGHTAGAERSPVAMAFSIVDKEARRALKAHLALVDGSGNGC